MKHKLILFIFIAFASIVLSGYRSGAANNNGTDGTGAEGTGTGTGCGGGGCHGSTSSIATTVELDSAGVAVTSYVPGGAYTVKITATNSTGVTLAKFGFQLATVTAATGGSGSATQAGTWGSTLPTYVQNTPGGGSGSGLNIPIIEQTRAISPTTGTGANGTVYSESIPWTAPAAGTGSISIYGVMNAVNNNGNADQTDKWQQATPVTITEAFNCPSVSASASSTTLTALPAGATSYQWYRNGTAVGGATSSTYAPVSSGSYTVQVTSPGGCTGTSSAVSFIVTGISEESLSTSLQVYPTVTRGVVNVKANTSMTAMIYTIYGLDGRIYDNGTIASGTGNTAIDMSKLAGGMYIMHIENQNRVATYKLIKE